MLSDFFNKLVSDRKLLGRFILFSVTLILVIACLATYASRKMEDRPPLPSYAALKCSKCGRVCTERVASLESSPIVCIHCGGKLGYRMKCDDCEFEFAFVPSNHELINSLKDLPKPEKVTKLLEARLCPNCGSTSTHFLPPSKRTFEEGAEIPAQQ